MSNTTILYQEYVRLQSVLNVYTNSSFSDFQLLGVIGFLLVWEPFSNKLAAVDSIKVKKSTLLFFGFSAIAFLFFVIATRDLMKQSIVFFYLSEIARYESAVRESLKIKDPLLFSASTNFMLWWDSTHIWVSLHFRGLTWLFLTSFPMVLMWKNTKKLAFIYFGIVLLLSIMYFNSARLVMSGSERMKVQSITVEKEANK